MDGPLAIWCPAVALSRQDGRHSAVALLLKAALIQVSDYRLLGASGYNHVHVVLDQNLKLDLYSANTLTQQSTDRHVAPFRNITSISSFPLMLCT